MKRLEGEIHEQQEQKISWVERLLKNTDDMDAICDLFPGIIHLNHIETLDMVYLDKRTRGIIKVELNDLKKNGNEALLQHIEPECYKQVQEMYEEVAKQIDQDQVVSCFQAFRVALDAPAYDWYFTSTKRYNQNLTISVSTPLHTLTHLKKQVERVLDENLLIKKNLRRLSSLTLREREIMQLISQGVSSNHIAERLFISIHTVSTHRKNIWRKLEVNSYAELIKLAEHFDML